MERVVELVGDSGGEGADGGEFFRLHQLTLPTFSSRTIVLKASMTCCISSRVLITSILLKRPRAISSVAFLIMIRVWKILKIISSGRTIPRATAIADHATSCFFQ